VQLLGGRLAARVSALTAVLVALSLQLTPIFAQSSQVAAEWALFNQILIIGIIVGIVVFGLMFYAIIRYREKPQNTGGK